jgi:tetratricopeptide (TPR) repeat protein
LNWDEFVEKWNSLESHSIRFEICKETLISASHSSKIIALAGMWEIALQVNEKGDSLWSSDESKAYNELELCLKVSRDDVKSELSSSNKTVLEEVIKKYNSLYNEKNWIEVTDYYESKLTNASGDLIDCSVSYMWALFQTSGKETIAYKLGKELLLKHPNLPRLNRLLGLISKWLGNRDKSLELLAESINLFKLVNESVEIEKCKGDIIIIKQNTKEEAKKRNVAVKEQAKAFRLEEKAREKHKREEEKKQAKEEEMLKHKLKSSRGECYCVFCGKHDHKMYGNETCLGRENGHSFVFMKDKNDRWKLKCNKCGKRDFESREGCL